MESQERLLAFRPPFLKAILTLYPLFSTGATEPKNIPPEPGMRIRFLREKLGLTRKQFENITGVKANTLRHLEKGSQKLSPTTARVLANLFIFRFGIKADEASEDFLLHGEKEDDPAV